MKVHTFGDSHSVMGFNTVWSNKYGPINMHYVGPRLCYNFGLDPQISLTDEQYKVEEGDIVIFCFSEIDCRCHIHKHITEENTYQIIIDGIIERYLNTVKKLVEPFKILTTCIYNIPPPAKKETTTDNMAYPFRGENSERKTYVLYFNSKLKQKCPEYGFVFVDVYDKYIDNDGYLNPVFSDKNVHIDNGVFIREFIDNNV